MAAPPGPGPWALDRLAVEISEEDAQQDPQEGSVASIGPMPGSWREDVGPDARADIGQFLPPMAAQSQEDLAVDARQDIEQLLPPMPTPPQEGLAPDAFADFGQTFWAMGGLMDDSFVASEGSMVGIAYPMVMASPVSPVPAFFSFSGYQTPPLVSEGSSGSGTPSPRPSMADVNYRIDRCRVDGLMQEILSQEVNDLEALFHRRQRASYTAEQRDVVTRLLQAPRATIQDNFPTSKPVETMCEAIHTVTGIPVETLKKWRKLPRPAESLADSLAVAQEAANRGFGAPCPLPAGFRMPSAKSQAHLKVSVAAQGRIYGKIIEMRSRFERVTTRMVTQMLLTAHWIETGGEGPPTVAAGGVPENLPQMPPEEDASSEVSDPSSNESDDDSDDGAGEQEEGDPEEEEEEEDDDDEDEEEIVPPDQLQEEGNTKEEEKHARAMESILRVRRAWRAAMLRRGGRASDGRRAKCTATRRMVANFYKLWHLSRRHAHLLKRSKMAPEVATEKINCVGEAINKRIAEGVPKSRVYNMDAMNVGSLSGDTITIAPRGSDHVSINWAGNEKAGLTVVPFISLAGAVSPVFVIVRGKTARPQAKYRKAFASYGDAIVWLNQVKAWEDTPGGHPGMRVYPGMRFSSWMEVSSAG
jgi:hypothetical protein